MPRPPKNAFKFNDRSIRGLKPGASQADYMDLTVPGFGIRIFPSGHKTFFARYRHDRRFRRFTLGEYPTELTLKQARKLCKDALSSAARGEDFQAKRLAQRTAPTFADLAASYLEVHAKRRKRTWKEDQRILNRELLPAWRHLPAATIRRGEVARLLDRIAGRGAPIMANRVRALASKIFAFGLAREIVEFNPVAGVPPPGEEQKRKRVLAEEEIRCLWTLWEAEGSVSSAILRVLLLTGQRLGEVLTMRWEDIDGDWWTIPPHITKNKQGHRVFLSAQVHALLGQLRRAADGRSWVFPSPRTSTHIASLNTAVDRFRALSRLSDWHAHDLRRTAATGMGDLEIQDSTIGLVLNHAVPGVTARYSRSNREAEIARALRLWGQRLDEIVHRGAPLENVIKFG